jgi:hypothetical protein
VAHDVTSVQVEMMFLPCSLYLQHGTVSCLYRSFNAMSYVSQSCNSPYKKGVSKHTLWGSVLLSGYRKFDVTFLTAASIFVTKLLTSTHRHFSRNTFLIYEVCNPTKASCIQQFII